ncbi:hypothetical protein M5689_010076 [Euphorbia peplus]|nr:hypothetical protein M5689_010076 [Euphorbia peplus]
MGTISNSKSYFLVLLIIVSISSSLESRITEARTLSFLPAAHQLGKNSNIFATLGVVCKCCDGEEDKVKCKDKWEGSCLKLQCLPWKNIDLQPTKSVFNH